MADKSKDTGTGGINIDGAVYTADVGVPNDQGGAQGAYSSGDVSVDKTVKDISRPTRETFAKYLSKSTLGTAGSSSHKNAYPVGAGAQTTLTETSLKDAVGNPVSPGAQANEAKFSQVFNQSISSNNPAGIRRGLATGSGPDGNVLLPGASTAADTGTDFIKFVTPSADGKKGLTVPVKDYTATAIAPNLFNFDSKKVGLSDGTLNQSPIDRRNIKVISLDASVATDGGTSKNILGPSSSDNYTFTEIKAAKIPVQITTGINVFAVDSPTVVSKNGVDTLQTVKTYDESSLTPLSATAAQSNISNANYFTALKTTKNSKEVTISLLQSSYTQALAESKGLDVDETKRFELARGRTRTDASAPDGHKLLRDAVVPPQAPSEDFIKFVPADQGDDVGLNKRLKTYVTKVLNPNLYNPFDPQPLADIVIGDGGDVAAAALRNVKYMPADVDVRAEGGTSKNILSGEQNKYVLEPLFAAEAAHRETTQRYNKFTVDSHADFAGKINFFKPSSAAPLAETINSKKFGSINIGVSPTIFSKGKLVVQDPNDKTKKLPDGNELLYKATNPGAPGPYIRSSGELKDPIRLFTDGVFKNNLRQIGAVDIYPRGKPFDQFFYGPFVLFRPTGDDAGTFDNVIADPTKRWFTKNDALRKVKTEVAGDNLPVGQRNYYTPFDTTNPENYEDTSRTAAGGFTGPFFDSNGSLTYGESGYPKSPTVEQSIVDESATWKFEPDLRNVTSYSEEGLTKLSIKRGKSDFSGPNGNELLKKAAEPSKANTFIKTDAKLNDTIGGYVSEVLRKNRYKPTSAENSPSNLFVGSNTPGAEVTDGNPTVTAKIENISDDVSAADRSASFLSRTTLYRPRSLTLGESPQSSINRGVPIIGYDFRRLSRIGTILQLRAAGEISILLDQGGPTPGDPSSDPRSNLHQLAALLPGLGQAGAGVPFSRELLNVDDIIQFLPTDELEGTLNSAAQYEGELIDFNRTFEGTVNSSLEKFSGFSALGMIVLAAVLVLVIVVAFDFILGKAIGASLPADSLTTIPDGYTATNSNGVAGLGAFHGRLSRASSNVVADIIAIANQPPGSPPPLAALFGIIPTRSSYSDCVSDGTTSFFGLDGPVPPAFSYTGYIVVAARAIVRSATRVVLAFVDLVKLFATGNIFSGIMQLIEIIDIIRNSRLIKASNMFAQIGDRDPISITGEKYKKNYPEVSGIRFDQTSDLDVGVKISEIDSIVPTDVKLDVRSLTTPAAPSNERTRWVSTAHVKSRIDAGFKPLAWSSYRSPSLFLLPQNKFGKIGVDGNDVTRLSGAPKKPPPDKKNEQSFRLAGGDGLEVGVERALGSDVSRISQQNVDLLEGILDGEHVPFYFHDLRTNEILAFHAFLTSLTDDYTANYESVEGLGRIEPIKSYKSTQRRVGLSFILPALDEQDFVHMWDKINKLTTLVYPQWTGGKDYENRGAGYRFEKPFTQLIAASPMIRLRVGNLFRSNYSRFNLAGVFGLHDQIKTAIADPAVYDANKDPKLVLKLAQRAEAAAQAGEEFDKDKKNFFKTGYKYAIKDGVYFKTPPEPAAPKGKPPTGQAQAQVRTTQSVNQQNNQATATAQQKKGQPPPTYKHYQKKRDAETKTKTTPAIKAQDEGSWFNVIGMSPNFYAEVTDASAVAAVTNEVPVEGWVKVKFQFETPTDAQRDILPDDANNGFWVPIDKLTPTKQTQDKIAGDKTNRINTEADKVHKIPASGQGDIPADLKDANKAGVVGFMKPENNAIVRSFESAGGKGLAGFIDTIAFDWFDKVTWDLDHKAPKMCKVTIGFSPIHDISPGLDKFGHNRAPIYPLGNFSYDGSKQ